MRENSVYSKYLQIGIINIFVLLICFISSYNVISKYIIYSTVLSIYYIFLLAKKDEIEIVLYQIILFIISNFLLDFTFHYLKLNTPLELKYICEGISVILILHILIKKKRYRDILKDPLILIVLLISIFSLIMGLIRKNDLLSLINTFRIYFRFIPTYIVMSYSKQRLEAMYKVLFIINLIIFTVMSLLGGHQDLRTGIFGIIGSSSFYVFIMLFYITVLLRYLYKQISFSKFIIVLITTILMLAIAESKAYIVISIFVSLIILLIINTKVLKKVITIILLLVTLGFGWNLMIKMYPKFSYLADMSKVTQYMESYIFGNSNKANFTLGRFDAAKYIISKEHDTIVDSFIGMGLGQSISPENLFHKKSSNGRQEVWDFPQSNIFLKYGPNFGYHLSSLSIIVIDGGYVGIAVLIFILILLFYRGFHIIKKGNDINVRTFGAITIFLVISGIYTIGYSSGLNNRGYLFMCCIVLGISHSYYINLKNRN